jgi:Zn-dependent protease/predicted transcriptional regulator
VTPTLRLGRLFGIEIGLNWSLVFVFVLVAWSLASQLPGQVPGHANAEYWIAGIAGAVIFYVCLLAHELAHSLVAQRQGVKVSGITLWLFGGVSQLEGEPKRASSEALITIVGPVASLLLAAVCYALALLSSTSGQLELVSRVLGWLALINLSLGIFNLVPAFPLDGGRLLSSLLWWRTGSRRRGLSQAVRIGRLFAYAMIVFGFVGLFFGFVLSGIWIAFIGWFLLSAAHAEEASVAMEDLLRSVPVSAAMSSPVVTIPDWLTVEQFLTNVAPTHSFTTYPLQDMSGRLSGVVRLGELVRHPTRDQPAKRLREVSDAVSDLPRAVPGEDLSVMLKRIGPALQRRVLVFDGNDLVGIVSPADIARLLTVRQAAQRQP